MKTMPRFVGIICVAVNSTHKAQGGEDKFFASVTHGGAYPVSLRENCYFPLGGTVREGNPMVGMHTSTKQ